MKFILLLIAMALLCLVILAIDTQRKHEWKRAVDAREKELLKEQLEEASINRDGDPDA